MRQVHHVMPTTADDKLPSRPRFAIRTSTLGQPEFRYASTTVLTHERMYVCMHACMCVCRYVSRYVCMYVSKSEFMHALVRLLLQPSMALLYLPLLQLLICLIRSLLSMFRLITRAPVLLLLLLRYCCFCLLLPMTSLPSFVIAVLLLLL